MGGGAKSRLCATCYPLNPKLSLYTLLFAFYFFIIASECIARVRRAIKSKMLCQIDFRAKNRSRSFLFAMTGKTANTLPCHTETLCRSIHRKITLLNSILDTSLTLSMTANASLRAVFAKTAWQSINLALFLLFGLPRLLCSLAMTARYKFKFFTQNSRHFTNSNHFINLSQILSHTQGFFIFLPQIFYIFTQIAFKILKNSTQGVRYEQ